MTPDDVMVPLVFGVTGHRDLRPQDVPALEERVRGIFVDFRACYPDTPLVLLSPLAEGADRLAARVALSCGVDLVVPLPMRRQEYEKDFESAESRAEFLGLLEAARSCLELPPVKGSSDEAIAKNGDLRTWQYTQVGAYIVLHCQVLIALWDGVSSDKAGGTAQVVQFQRDDIPADVLERLSVAPLYTRSLLDPPDTGPVYHILTPRRSNPTPGPGQASGDGRNSEGQHPCDLCVLRSRGDGTAKMTEKAETKSYRNIDAYNAGMCRDWDRLQQIRHRSAQDLFPEAQAAGLGPSLVRIRSLYSVADALAQGYQTQVAHALTGLFVCIAVAVVGLECYAHLPGHPVSLLASYLVLSVTAWAWYRKTRRDDVQNHYQDCRAFAEGLRIEFFWALAGLPFSVTDHYLRKQKSDLEWIRIALRNVLLFRSGRDGPPAEVERVAPSESAHRIGLVMERWVQGQAAYFEGKALPRDRASLERFERMVRVCLALSLLTAFLAWVAEARHLMPGESMLTGGVIILISLSAVGSALFHDYASKRAFEQHVKQYERMGDLFSRAHGHLKRLVGRGQYAAAEALLLEIGKEALAESADWVVMHRERPVDVPHAG